MMEKEAIRKLTKAIKEAPSSFFAKKKSAKEESGGLLSFSLARFAITEWNKRREKYKNENFNNNLWQVDLLAALVCVITSSLALAKRKEDYIRFLDYMYCALIAVGLEGKETYLNKSILRIGDILDMKDSMQLKLELSNAIFGDSRPQATMDLLQYIQQMSSGIGKIIENESI